MRLAACYARSSKDRSDVSIDAQRRELHDLAAAKGLVIVAEYADAVESAKDEDRPDFQRLLRDMRGRKRQWTYLLAVDTSRLSRARYFATVFKHECKKLGITILYSKMPQGDPVMDEMLEGIMEVVDQFHSRMSRSKGLSGMRENVRQGHRAGGRAPFGYRLVHESTGATRDGAPVMKSRLEPSTDAPRIAGYLRDRAAGVPRLRAREKAGLDLADTTLIGIERNALTYAGSTVWNVHAERVKGGYAGGKKRRPRAQWVVQEGTHAALITKDEAETLLSRAEEATRTRARPVERVYLLSGLLRAPDGSVWHGDGGDYRCGKGRKVGAERLEVAVLDALSQRLTSDSVVFDLERRIRELYGEDAAGGELRQLESAIRDLSRNIDRVSALLVETTAPQALLRSIEGWEAERSALLDRKIAIEARARDAVRMRAVNAEDVRRLLAGLADELRNRDRASLKDALARLVEAVELDPATFACSLHYRVVPLKSGGKLASPRGAAGNPTFCDARAVPLPFRRIRAAA